MRREWSAAVAVALGALGICGASPAMAGPYAFDPSEVHAAFLDGETLRTACARELRCHEGIDDLQTYCETLGVLVEAGGAAAQTELAAGHLNALVTAMGTASSKEEGALRRRLDESLVELKSATEMIRAAIAHHEGSYGDIAMAARSLVRARDQLGPAQALASAARSGRLTGRGNRNLARLRDAAVLTATAADTLTSAGRVLEQGESPDPGRTRVVALRERAGQSCGVAEGAPLPAGLVRGTGDRVDARAVGAALWGHPPAGEPSVERAVPSQVRRALKIWCPAEDSQDDHLALLPETCTLLDRAPDVLSAGGLALIQTSLRADLAVLPRLLGEEMLRISDPHQEHAWEVRDAAAVQALLGRVAELALSGLRPSDALAALGRSRAAASLPVSAGGASLSVRRTPMAAAIYVGSAALAVLPEDKAAPADAARDRIWAAGALVAMLSHSPGLTEGVSGVWNVTPEDIQRVANNLGSWQSLRSRSGPAPEGLEPALTATFALVASAVRESGSLQYLLPGTQWPQPERADWAEAALAQAETLHLGLSAFAAGDPARATLQELEVLDALALRAERPALADQALAAVSSAVGVALAPDVASARAALSLAGEPPPKRRLGAGERSPYLQLNLYAGAGGGAELGGGVSSGAAWPMIAVGPELGMRLGKGALGLFMPVIDPGALATWRFDTETLGRADGFSLLPLFTPGLDLVYAVPRLPLSLGLGASLVPGLRQAGAGEAVTVVRGGLFLALDVPIRR